MTSLRHPLLAALALAGIAPAFAQQLSVVPGGSTNITVYGRIDVGIGKIAKDIKTSEDVLTQVKDSSTGRWGLRATRELGGELSALFNLENRYFADTGTQDGVEWKDKAFVGLSHKRYGKVTLGRQSSPMDDRGVNGRFEAFGGDSLASSGSRGAKFVAKWDNSVYYQSPLFNGVGVALAKSFAETGTSIRKNLSGVLVDYAQGPLVAAFSQQTDATTTDDWKSTALSASYDFGVAKLMGIWGKSTDLGADNQGEQKVLTLGAQIPAGPGQVRVSGQSRKDNAALGSAKEKRLGLGYQWVLDASTTVNFSLLKQNYTKGTVDNSANQYEVAIRYNF